MKPKYMALKFLGSEDIGWQLDKRLTEQQKDKIRDLGWPIRIIDNPLTGKTCFINTFLLDEARKKIKK